MLIELFVSVQYITTIFSFNWTVSPLRQYYTSYKCYCLHVIELSASIILAARLFKNISLIVLKMQITKLNQVDM